MMETPLLMQIDLTYGFQGDKLVNITRGVNICCDLARICISHITRDPPNMHNINYFLN